MILYIHKEKTDEIDITKVAQEFITVNDRRTTFLAHFNECMLLLHLYSSSYSTSSSTTTYVATLS